ncbi:phosphate starvation-inducible protein PhoH [Rhizobium leguminosarum]|uniref:hypothetical protein n=1 Tax=Rhizobium TaxID=379 RepID=UPI00160A244A|nr:MULTISPECIES: hypothetical protein [Rhizobium]MBB4297245.1 phosphate starvation-inducible protein PhoH [Rhizobium leguminosarum]MBB4415329.1 phosphate starvation-inducible protein PhoH [Rhizobium leguminosarum]MBB4431704.1 phosphate starvation-inducible protein PhoH [Rhizobium esperanzae]MBB4539680.1 phosphate starvation-inducible protein PhoH [Rhizobium leguminosarum]MBB5651927.1 phosphate starvation-inducible protein PhoH [Rhizobium leguminosarum]
MDLKAYREEQLKVIGEIEDNLKFITENPAFRISQKGPDGEVDITAAHIDRCKRHLDVMKRAVEITDAKIADRDAVSARSGDPGGYGNGGTGAGGG